MWPKSSSAFFGAAGLAQDALAKGGDLVAADHERPGLSGGDGPRFGQRQPPGEVGGRFPLERIFVGAGGDLAKGQPEAIQQATAVGGSGGENNVHGFGF